MTYRRMLYIFAVIKRNYFEIIMCVCFSLDTKHVHFEVISFFSLKRGISTYLKLTMVMFETKGRVTRGNSSCDSQLASFQTPFYTTGTRAN